MTKETKIVFGIGILTIIGVVAGALLFGNNQSSDKGSSIKADKKLLIRENSSMISSPGAKATLVEFADFECPACADANLVIKQILAENKGKVNYAYRHFPLPQHLNAQIAARTAEAAGEQGKFFEMTDLLYANQAGWTQSQSPMDFFVKYAAELKLDLDKFKQALENNKFEAKIQGDENDGNALGIESTPTFYINEEKVENLKNLAELKQKVGEKIKLAK